MLFNSPEFVIFMIAVFALYWTAPHRKLQNRLLLVASYVFYGFWSWKFLGLIIISTLVDYVCGQAIARAQDDKHKRRFLYVSLATNLGILGAFKYANFFISETGDMLTALGFQANYSSLDIILPIGISFYTFQTLSYTIDIYRGKLSPTRDLFDFALFVSFFPQLVAGPIERATNLLPQIQARRSFSMNGATLGIQLIFWGMFKKVVIADNLAPYVDAVYGAPDGYSGMVLMTATVFFAFQIYCDFSGYSDIARGTAKTLGFDITINFRQPYFSRNPVEFWDRWHISLSKWFQDYLYFPLAMHSMRKGGWLAKYRAHIVAMTLIGFWHGANWTFVVFGFYWGVVIVLYLMVNARLAEAGLDVDTAGSRIFGRLSAIPSMLVMFAIACIGWVFFRADTIGDALSMLVSFARASGADTVLGAGAWNTVLLWLLIGGLMLVESIYLWSGQSLADRSSKGWVGSGVRYALMVPILLSYIVSLGTSAQPFIYFQF